MANRPAVAAAVERLGRHFAGLSRLDALGLEDWARALSDLTDEELDLSVSQWLREEGRPPRPADIRNTARAHRPRAGTSGRMAELPPGCSACQETGRRYVAILRWEPLGHNRRDQRQELREFCCACSCALGSHYRQSHPCYQELTQSAIRDPDTASCDWGHAVAIDPTVTQLRRLMPPPLERVPWRLT